ncbi:MAG: ABC transporter transmembrane domain-containing protein [Desulfobacterales bacterium]|nr:ABC transporter transmembrane domain-containing protein [Desulfobacterales bacterium]
MEKVKTPVFKRSLFSWVFSGNIKLQVLLLIIVIATVFARVLPLEMQKRIINEAINLRKIDLLFIYCGIYIAAVVVASGLKFLINVLQSVIGQQASASMRKGLYHHILTLPLNFFRRTQPGMVVASLITELATAGDFIGMAVAIPVTSILTLIAFAAYLFWLNPLLAALSLSIYPLVIFLLPWLQKKANRENKKRVDTTRDLSSRIAESITGIHEIQGNGAFGIENRKYDGLVDKLTKVRIRWNVFRFAIKVSNNFFNNLSPFVIFMMGGYLAIKGQLELGALVAFLSAQEKLYDPWRELIDFYQAHQDATVSYKRTMEYFDAESEYVMDPVDRKPFELDGNIEVKDLSFQTETGVRLLSEINFSLKSGEHLALVGFSGSGKSTLALCIGQLYKYTGGNVLIGDKEVATLTKKDLVQNVGFVSQSPFIFDGTIEENLLYACRAKLNGNDSSPGDSLPNLDDRIEVLQQTGIFVDVLRFGLNTVLAYDHDKEFVTKIIRVRENFQRNFGKALADYVEFFDDDRYLYYSSISENLILGTPGRDEFSEKNLLKNDYFTTFLKQADLRRPLMNLGADLSRQTVDILGNLPPDEVFFQQSPLQADELEDYKLLAEHLRKRKLHQLSTENQEKLLALALRFTPGRHKMAALPEVLEKLILEGRSLFREKISTEDPAAVSFYDTSEYIYSQTILNNIFFGKTKNESPQAQEKIDQSIIQLLIAEDLLETVIKIGMDFQVGSKGDKLSGGQRQKLAIARAFLKDPMIMILDEATSALDNKSQARIQNLLETRWKGKSTVIAVVHRLDIIKNYDRVAVMKAGKIGELGSYDELMAKKGMLYELVHGKK